MKLAVITFGLMLSSFIYAAKPLINIAPGTVKNTVVGDVKDQMSEKERRQIIIHRILQSFEREHGHY